MTFQIRQMVAERTPINAEAGMARKIKAIAVLAVSMFFIGSPSHGSAQDAQSPGNVPAPATTLTDTSRPASVPPKMKIWFLGDHLKGTGSALSKGAVMDVEIQPDGSGFTGKVTMYAPMMDHCRPVNISMLGRVDGSVLVLTDAVPASDNMTCRFGMFELNLVTRKGRYDLGPGKPGDLIIIE